MTVSIWNNWLMSCHQRLHKTWCFKALMSSARYAVSICTPGAYLFIARASVLFALGRPNKNYAEVKMFTCLCLFWCNLSMGSSMGAPALCMTMCVTPCRL